MVSNPIFLSVVIPAYNEEQRLPHTLKAVTTYLNKQEYTWEIAVVDDGSKDKTADLVRAVSITDRRVRLLQYGKNHGKGYAVRYGMTHTTGQYRLFMDADNSTTVDHFAKFLPIFSQGYDAVIGSRDVEGAQIDVHQAKWKELLGDLGNLWIQFWAVPGIKDTQAGFKVFTAKASDDIFPRLTIDRWGFDVEALAVARRLDYKISEQPIRWINDPNSKVSTKAYIDVLKEVVQVRMNMWKGVYDTADKQ
ncbi:MAG: dolichyl-phosphate beta-glucosyltransferase [Candidatus Andersenbacteria bacterium]